jgi:hypothetical protein
MYSFSCTKFHIDISIFESWQCVKYLTLNSNISVTKVDAWKLKAEYDTVWNIYTYFLSKSHKNIFIFWSSIFIKCTYMIISYSPPFLSFGKVRMIERWYDFGHRNKGNFNLYNLYNWALFNLSKMSLVIHTPLLLVHVIVVLCHFASF